MFIGGPKAPVTLSMTGTLFRRPVRLVESASVAQPPDQRLRQTSVLHLPLSLENVVRDAVVLHLLLLLVENGEGGAPVAVAWLAHRSGVDQVARTILEW